MSQNPHCYGQVENICNILCSHQCRIKAIASGLLNFRINFFLLVTLEILENYNLVLWAYKIFHLRVPHTVNPALVPKCWKMTGWMKLIFFLIVYILLKKFSVHTYTEVFGFEAMFFFIELMWYIYKIYYRSSIARDYCGIFSTFGKSIYRKKYIN